MSETRGNLAVKKVASIEFWRFLFTVFVVLGHMQASSDALGPTRFTTGGYAVEFFFILSGYLLMRSFSHKFSTEKSILRQTGAMLWGKLRRFVPICWACIAVSAAYHVHLYRAMQYTTEQLLTYVKNLWPEVLMLNSIFYMTDSANGASWYISALLIVGTLVYLILAVCKKLHISAWIPAVVCPSILMYAYYWKQHGTQYAFLLRALCCIFLGVLCCLLIDRFAEQIGRIPSAVWLVVQIVSVVAIAGILFVRASDAHTQPLVIPWFFLLVFTTFGPATWLNNVLNNSFSVFLGKISLVIYLTHNIWITKFLWEPGFDLRQSRVLTYCVILITILLTSVVFTYLPALLRSLWKKPEQKIPGIATDRVLYPDVVRAFAIMGVIVLHVAGGSMWAVAPGQPNFNVLAGMDTLVHCAVPLFLMASGMFLLNPDKRVTLGDVFQKYIKRLLIAYVGWSVFYALYNAVFEGTLLTEGAMGVWNRFFEGRYHLWFLPMMVGVYLMVPLLRCITEKRDRKLLLYVILLFGLYATVYPSVKLFAPGMYDVLRRINPGTFGAYVGCFLAGYYFSTIKVSRRAKYGWTAAAIVGAIAAVTSVLIFSQRTGELAEAVWGMGSVPMAMYTISLFMVFRIYADNLQKKPRLLAFLQRVAGLSFIIYLCHDVYITLCAKIGLTAISWSPWISVPVISAAVLAASIISAELLLQVKAKLAPWNARCNATLQKAISNYKTEYTKLGLLRFLQRRWLLLAALVGILGMLCFAKLQTMWSGHERRVTDFFFLSLYFVLGAALIASVQTSIKKLAFSRRQWSKIAAVGAVCAVAMGLFLYWFLAQENTIKTWDSCGYWSKLVSQTSNFYTNIPQALQTLLSTFSVEYSDLAIVPLVPFGAHLGLQFYKYAVLVYGLYYVPVCFLMGLYAARVCARATGKPAKPWHVAVSMIVSLLCVPLFHPITLGYVDVVGVLLILMMLHYTLEWKWDEFHPAQNLFLAVLSLTLLFARRWYAFYIVGFYVSFGVEFLWQWAASKRFDTKRFLYLVLNLVSIAGVCLLWILFMAPDALKTFFGVNYGEAYTAYKMRTDLGDLLYLAADFGWLLTLVALVGIFFVLWKKASRPIGVRWLTAFAVVFVLFERVQSAGEHHRYLFIPTLLFGICAAVIYMGEQKKKVCGGAAVTAVVALCGWNMAFAYLPALYPVKAYRGTFFTQVREKPSVRTDIAQIRGILAYMNEETERQHAKGYVVADSDVMSQEVLKRAFMPETTDAATNIISGSIIDLRDGFPSSAFLADYVLVPTPLELKHGSGSEVIRRLYELFETSPAIQKYYSLVKTEAAEDVTYQVYQKTQPVTKELVDELSDVLRQDYPDTPFVYEPDYFWALFSIDTDASYDYYSWGPCVYLTPAPKTTVSWQLTGDFHQLSFGVVNWNQELYYQVTVDGVKQEPQPVELDKSTITLDVTGVQKLQIEWLPANAEDVSLLLMEKPTLS